jgi:AcrR family transcriptional regulator
MFAKRGFHATSMRDIAREAEVDAALIVHLFGSKDAIWTAVLDQVIEQTAGMITQTAALRSAEMTPGKRVEVAVTLLIAQVFREPDFGMFFSTAATEEGKRLDALVARMVKPYHAAFAPLLRDAAEANEITVVDVDVMCAMLINAITKTVAYSHLLDKFSDLPQDAAKFESTVLTTALNMLGVSGR